MKPWQILACWVAALAFCLFAYWLLWRTANTMFERLGY